MILSDVGPVECQVARAALGPTRAGDALTCVVWRCTAALGRADGRDRTGDIRFTRAVLYQLSYVGIALAS